MLNFKETTKYKKMWPNDLLVICYFQKHLKQFSSTNIKKVTIFEKKRRFYRRKRRVAALELSTLINFSKSAFKSNTSFIHHMLYENATMKNS